MAKQPFRALRGRQTGVPSSGSSKIRALCPPSPAYDRRTAIAAVLALWPHELEDESPTGRLAIIAKLRRALRAERQRGLAGHWTYDLARHVELLRVYRLESKAAAGLPEAGAQANRSPPAERRLANRYRES